MAKYGVSSYVLSVVRREERERSALLLHTSSASDAVNVILGHLWKIIVDHIFDVVNVYIHSECGSVLVGYRTRRLS